MQQTFSPSQNLIVIPLISSPTANTANVKEYNINIDIDCNVVAFKVSTDLFTNPVNKFACLYHDSLA